MGKNKSISAGFSLYACNTPSNSTCTITSVYEPVLRLVLQGSKALLLGQQELLYTPGSYFINVVELPISSRIASASPEHPYMALSVPINPEKLVQLAAKYPPIASTKAHSGIQVFHANQSFLEPWLKLVKLLDTPSDLDFFAPMIEQEILYRLLQDQQLGLLKQLSTRTLPLQKIRLAIQWIREHYRDSFTIAQLAEQVAMSSSTLHRHFKEITSLSPLQYQKTLRLQEARQLLLTGLDVAKIAYQVGYESPSQFSREYARMFNRAPSADGQRLRHQGFSPEGLITAPWDN
ncbi:AraC family transcriptional regulator N-terminal domain-containing protein [Celerinatantimonas sp. YJH-8]|uniref:AraC family transcriptional regulator n=1 Tax=Celerinatantimonas sp. YJH-8 TaxID=3228714 RepID=UPI0038C77B64